MWRKSAYFESKSSHTGCGRDAYLRIFPIGQINHNFPATNTRLHSLSATVPQWHWTPNFTGASLWLLTSSHRLNAEPERNFSPTLDQVSLRLFALSDFCEIYVNARPGEEEKRKPAQRYNHSHVHVVIAPRHTFLFRQHTAAQAEQRGEADPLHKTGCHRVFEAPGEKGVIPCPPTFTIFRFVETSQIFSGVFFFFPVKWKDFFLLWETLTAPPPRGYLQQSELMQREDKLLAADVNKREDRCASQTAQVEAEMMIFIETKKKKKHWAHCYIVPLFMANGLLYGKVHITSY